jgi:hypothetical protein
VKVLSGNGGAGSFLPDAQRDNTATPPIEPSPWKRLSRRQVADLHCGGSTFCSRGGSDARALSRFPNVYRFQQVLVKARAAALFHIGRLPISAEHDHSWNPVWHAFGDPSCELVTIHHRRAYVDERRIW